MLEVIFKRKFERQLEKMPLKIQNEFDERLALYKVDRRHPLHGKRKGFYSMSVTDDIRAVFKLVGNAIVFHEIGTQ